MFNKKFFISWIFSALAMFGISYVWHGLVMFDLKIISTRIPLPLYLAFAAVAYLVIGAVVSRVYSMEYFKTFTRQVFLRGLIAGAVCGFLIFIISLVTGVSFAKNSTSAFIFVDMTWQIIEQAIGGFVVGIVHAFVWDDSMMRSQDID